MTKSTSFIQGGSRLEQQAVQRFLKGELCFRNGLFPVHRQQPWLTKAVQALTAVSADFQAFSELWTTLNVTVFTEVLFAIVAHGGRFLWSDRLQSSVTLPLSYPNCFRGGVEPPTHSVNVESNNHDSDSISHDTSPILLGHWWDQRQVLSTNDWLDDTKVYAVCAVYLRSWNYFRKFWEKCRMSGFFPERERSKGWF